MLKKGEHPVADPRKTRIHTLSDFKIVENSVESV